MGNPEKNPMVGFRATYIIENIPGKIPYNKTAKSNAITTNLNSMLTFGCVILAFVLRKNTFSIFKIRL